MIVKMKTVSFAVSMSDSRRLARLIFRFASAIRKITKAATPPTSVGVITPV